MQLATPINVAATRLPSPDGGATFPAGDYPAVALASRVRASANDDQSGLVEYDCMMIDGAQFGLPANQFANQSFKIQFNVYNKNPDAMRIGTEQLAAFAACVGFRELLTDTDMLLQKPFQVCFRARTGADAKEGQTQFRGTKDIHGNDPANAGKGPKPAGQPAAPAQQAAAPAAAAPAPGFAPPGNFAAAPVAAPAAFGPPAAGGAWGGGAPTQQAPAVAAAPAWAPAAGGAAAPAAGGAPAWAQPR